MNAARYLRKVARLRERDGDLCWLCEQPIDFGVPPGHRNSPTLDHVIPAVHGGSYADSNIKLAHKLCNHARGDAIRTVHWIPDEEAAA